MSGRHASFIAGEERAGERGFDVPAADGTSLGAWPRATHEELAEAARAARAAGAAQAERPGGERLAHARALERALADAPDPGGRLARRLGLAPEELALHHPLPASAPEAGEPQDGRPAILRAHWTGLWKGLVAPARACLARGGALVVLSDPRAPMLADALAAAARRAGLPPGLLQVLHDDRPEALALLAAELPEARVSVAAPGDELEALAARIERARGAAGAPGFGAGVVSAARTPAPRLERLGAGARGVAREEDPAVAARGIAREALGRIESLSGQLPGRPQRVLVAERLFSAFTEALLEALRELPGPPVPALEPSDRGWLARARELGLDEGATLLVDRLEGTGSPPDGAWATLVGLVFTNVEPGLRLARLDRPAPLLRLVRVREGDDPRALAAALEGPPGRPGALRPEAGTDLPEPADPRRAAGQGPAASEPMEPGP